MIGEQKSRIIELEKNKRGVLKRVLQKKWGKKINENLRKVILKFSPQSAKENICSQGCYIQNGFWTKEDTEEVLWSYGVFQEYS